MVALVQWLERLAVAEEVMGSNPIGHPKIFREVLSRFFISLTPLETFDK
jgi:hypothetical protein